MNSEPFDANRTIVPHAGGKPLVATGFFDAKPMAYTPVTQFRMHQEVYLKHREEKKVGVVIAIMFRGPGVTYEVAWPHLDGASKWHCAVELASEYEPVYG